MSLPALPQPGETVGGKYELVGEAASGGMGIIFEAIHVALQQRVAIKFVRPDAPGLTSVAERFESEARTMAKMQSIHVARVIDVDRLPNGLPYVVFEYLEGQDLSAAIEQAGSLPVEDAVDIVVQVAEGMGEAHALGIVHRDLKPANVFLTLVGKRTIAKVLDFGVACATVADRAAAGSFLGTPQYAAPEQLRDPDRADERSDVWSLGVILYEALTGHSPFDAPSETEIVTKVLTAAAPPPTRWRADLPPALADVVARALDKNPQGRFQSTEEMAAALAEFGPSARVSTQVRAATAPTQRLGDILVADGLLKPADLERALAQQQVSGDQLGRVLLDLGLISNADLLTALAKQHGIIATADRGVRPTSAAARGASEAPRSAREGDRPRAGPRTAKRVATATVVGLSAGVVLAVGLARHLRASTSAAAASALPPTRAPAVAPPPVAAAPAPSPPDSSAAPPSPSSAATVVAAVAPRAVAAASTARAPSMAPAPKPAPANRPPRNPAPWDPGGL